MKFLIGVFSPVDYQKPFIKCFNTDDMKLMVLKLRKLGNDHEVLTSQIRVQSHFASEELQSHRADKCAASPQQQATA